MNQIVKIVAFALVSAGMATPAIAAPSPYEINVIASLSGPGAFIGKQDVDTFAALERNVNKHGGINGTPVHFAFIDDQTNPQVSVQLANQIIAKGAQVLLGPTITSTCRAITPLVAQNGPVTYCLTPGVEPAKGGFQFSASISTRDYLSTFLAYANKHRWRRIAVLTSIDATGQVADDQIAELAGRPENKGLEFVAREHFNNTDVSIAAQIARIKASNPDVIHCVDNRAADRHRILGHSTIRASTFPSLRRTANQTHAQMKQYAIDDAKGATLSRACFTQPGTFLQGIARELQAFYQACREMGIKPDLQAGFAWDPALIILDALRHVGTNATAAQLHAYIEGLHGFMGIAGAYDFRDGSNRGISAADTVMMRWDGSKDNWTPLR